MTGSARPDDGLREIHLRAGVDQDGFRCALPILRTGVNLCRHGTDRGAASAGLESIESPEASPQSGKEIEGRAMKDAFDLWWEWARKPVESMLMIGGDIQYPIMSLASEDRRERAKVNEAVRLYPGKQAPGS
jgi:hypothetical protein